MSTFEFLKKGKQLFVLKSQLQEKNGLLSFTDMSGIDISLSKNKVEVYKIKIEKYSTESQSHYVFRFPLFLIDKLKDIKNYNFKFLKENKFVSHVDIKPEIKNGIYLAILNHKNLPHEYAVSVSEKKEKLYEKENYKVVLCGKIGSYSSKDINDLP